MRHLLPATLLASVLLPASVAFAQPSAAAPAPQTHDWNDVSHINGQLVPVGDSNQYVKKFRRTNISSNPVGWIVGFYGVSGSYAVNDHVAIRGDANYYNLIDSNLSGTEIGVGAPIYLRRTYQGAFLEPGIIVRHTENNYCSEDYASSDCIDETDTVGPQMLFGWHWTWDSGFNVAFAVGAGRNLKDDSGESLFGNGYFRVGYAF